MKDTYNTFLDQLYFIIKKNKISLLILLLIFIAIGYYFERNIKTEVVDIHEYEFEIIKQYPDKYFTYESTLDKVLIQYSDRKFDLIKEIIKKLKIDYSNDNNFLTIQSYFMNKDFLYNTIKQTNTKQYSSFADEDLNKLEKFKEDININSIDMKNGIKIRLKSSFKINESLLKEIIATEYVDRTHKLMDLLFDQKRNTLISLLKDNILREKNLISEYSNNIKNNRSIVDYNNLQNCEKLIEICLYFLKYELDFESISTSANSTIIKLENSLNLLSELSPVKSFIFLPKISMRIYHQFHIPYWFVIPFILIILSIIGLTFQEFYLSNNRRKN